jgi:hypothetical protein
VHIEAARMATRLSEQLDDLIAGRPVPDELPGEPARLVPRGSSEPGRD